MKLKLLFLFPLILLFVLFLIFFPRFYLNELEYKGRQIFSSIEKARQIVDDHIEQRSGRVGGTKTVEELKNLSIDITADLNKVSVLVDEHESILGNQKKLSFLLTSKHKEYLKLKGEVFEKYYSSLRKFKSLKEYESAIMKVFITRDEFIYAMNNLENSESITSEEMNKIVDDYAGYRDDIKKYFDNGFMTEDLYNATLADINANIELYNLFVDAMSGSPSSEAIDQKVNEINDKYGKRDNVLDLFQDSYDKITIVKQNEWSDLFNQADELTFGALEYYETNKLAYDPLSVLLSKFNKNYPKNITLGNNSENTEELRLDLDGDGKEEMLRLTLLNDEEQYPETKSLIAFDFEGNEIARYPEDLPMAAPMSGSAKVYSLDKNSKKQFISYDFIAGPHSADTMFLGLRESNDGTKTILPICFVEVPQSALDCLFWSGEIGSLVVDDLDGDGFVEVVEMVDEYPSTSKLSSEEEKAIVEVFNEQEIGDFTNMAKTIAEREKGGRGNRVVWGIYRYNGEYFVPQLGVNYEKYYPLVTTYLKRFYKDYPIIMKKSEMSKDSLDYNEFMRDFWTNRN